jgi:YidC/Oxa1 family membrane protein insertase
MKFDKKKILTWVLYFLVFFTVLQFFNKPKAPPPELTANAITVVPAKSEFVSGEEVIVKIRNNTGVPITLPSKCPKNPLRVLAWTGEKFEERGAETKLNCAGVSDIQIAPNAESNITYTYWNYSLFGNPGRYKVEVAVTTGTGTGVFISPEFTVTEAGAFRKFFRTVFYQPLYNILVFFVRVAPARDLGLAIILLTLFIRLILLVPSQRAIVSQRRMQELQPKLEHIKKKYAGNKERVAQETMQLWKEHKVNPMGSCLPILIQFPVLIALFYVIQNGLNPDNVHLLYNPLKNVDLSNIHTNFLGILELTKINAFVLPLIVGALQFFQLKLTSVKKKPEEEKTQVSEMQSATKMMTYIMPVMIALFTASVPAGVGLYWGVSTVFAIGQQMVANKKSVIKS